MIKRKLIIIHFNGEVEEHVLKVKYDDWGITAVGCVLDTEDAGLLMIHPKSVKMMRQEEIKDEPFQK